jgi:hypothetical protein
MKKTRIESDSILADIPVAADGNRLLFYVIPSGFRWGVPALRG